MTVTTNPRWQRCGSRTAGRRLRNRRGAMAVLFAVIAVSVAMLGAVTIDLSRLANLKAELQQSADAAAHAGMQRAIACGGLLVGGCPLQATTTAGNYALASLAMQGTVSVDSNDVGCWNGVSYSTPCGFPNAVRVTVSRESTGLLMAIVGVAEPRVRARAVATNAVFLRSLPATSCPLPLGCPVLVQ